MTVNRLYETLKLVGTLDNQLRLQKLLERIRDVLAQLVESPANTQQQTALAAALSEFEKAAAKLRSSITPSQAEAIAELGGAEFFDPEIADKVQASISANAMTPSVASTFVQELAQRRAAFLQTVLATVQG